MTTAKVDDATDLFRHPDRADPLWSETAWLEVWGPDAGVGVFVHVGRFRGDPDLWWAQSVAFLPDGVLAASRSFARSPDSRERVALGDVTLTIDQPFATWRSTYAGAAVLTSTEELARGLCRERAAVPMSWSVEAQAGAPPWDLFGVPGTPGAHGIGGAHMQQTFTTSGTLTVAGRDYDLAGHGFNDHSSGPRTWQNFGGNYFIVASTQAWTLHAVGMWDRSGTVQLTAGSLFRDNEWTHLRDIAVTPLRDLTGTPREVPIVAHTADGEAVEFVARVLHTLPITITDDNDNLNGIDVERESPCVFAECPIQVVLPDGSTGYGHLERSGRLDEFSSVRR